MNFDEEAENNLEQERRELQREGTQLSQTVNQFEARYGPENKGITQRSSSSSA